MQVTVDMGLVAKSGAISQASPARLDLEELLATRLLVQGNSGSGKSHLLRRLLEQSADWVQQCIIDPEGDFVTLADKFDHVVVEAGRTAEELTRIAARIRQHRVSVVLNLEGLEADNQMRAAAAFLNGLFDTERDYWYPMLIVVDEAQLFAPSGGVEVSEEARRQSLSAMTNLMCRGRKRGLAGVIATQRLAKLAKNVAAEASNFLMGRTFLDIDMARAADLLGMERRQAEMFRDLKRGHFVALGPALSRRPLPIKIGEVATTARSSSPKLMPLPETPVDARDLIFTKTPEPHELVRPQAAVEAKATPTEDILQEVTKRQQEEQQAKQDETVNLFPEIQEQERQVAFRKILADMWEECCSIYQTGKQYPREANLYQDFLVRCRIMRLKGATPDLAGFRHLLNFVKSGCDEQTEKNPLWTNVCQLAESLDDDVQCIFLKLAVAAIRQEPCPPDATFARLYGTHSSRARSVMSFLEKRGLIVIRTDFTGKRLVILPDLAIETAGGDVEADDVIEKIWDGSTQASLPNNDKPQAELKQQISQKESPVEQTETLQSDSTHTDNSSNLAHSVETNSQTLEPEGSEGKNVATQSQHEISQAKQKEGQEEKTALLKEKNTEPSLL